MVAPAANTTASLIGQQFPSIMLSLKGRNIRLHDTVAERYGVIIGVPGAFDSKATEALLPAWKLAADFMQSSGLGFLGCLSVNDPFVIRGWAQRLKILNQIIFISDVQSRLVQSLHLEADASIQAQYGATKDRPRSDYFIIILGPKAKIQYLTRGNAVFSMNPIFKLLDFLGATMPPELQLEIRKRLRRVNVDNQEEGGRLREGVAGGECFEEDDVDGRDLPVVVPISATTALSAAASADGGTPMASGICGGEARRSYLSFCSDNCRQINDNTCPSVFFDYSGFQLCDSFLVEPLVLDSITQGITIRSADQHEDMGSLRLDYCRPLLFDGDGKLTDDSPTTAAARPNGGGRLEVRYKVRRLMFTRMLPLWLSSSVGHRRSRLEAVIVHEPDLSEEATRAVVARSPLPVLPLVVVVPLLWGGRDVTLANVCPLLKVRLEAGCNPQEPFLIDPSSGELDDPVLGIGIDHFVYSYLPLYRFEAPCPYLPGNAPATWLVSKNPCLASTLQIDTVDAYIEAAKGLAAAAPTSPAHNSPARADSTGGANNHILLTNTTIHLLSCEVV